MPDYLEDLREVIRRGEGSELMRSTLLRKVDRFELKLKRGGRDANNFSAMTLAQSLHGDPVDWVVRLCFARLVRHDYSDWSGWEYRNDFSRESRNPDLPDGFWDGKPCPELTVLGEQGVGDEIMFSSCIPDLEKLVGKIFIECDKRLVEIFKRSFGCEVKSRPGVTETNAKYLDLERGKPFIPMGDLPSLFRRSRSDFPSKPFLKPSDDHIRKWSHLKGRVGIAWRGRRGKLDVKDLGVKDPVCLQYESWPYETKEMEVPDIDLKNDLEDLLGICANLEKIVTVPQTIVHIAGSIGTKVEVIVPPVHTGRVKDQINYRYGLGGVMDWYKSVRVFTSLNEYR